MQLGSVGRVIGTLSGHEGDVTAVRWLGENRLASAASGGDIRVWTIEPRPTPADPLVCVCVCVCVCVRVCGLIEVGGRRGRRRERGVANNILLFRGGLKGRIGPRIVGGC